MGLEGARVRSLEWNEMCAPSSAVDDGRTVARVRECDGVRGVTSVCPGLRDRDVRRDVDGLNGQRPRPPMRGRGLHMGAGPDGTVVHRGVDSKLLSYDDVYVPARRNKVLN